jgi:orotate phosphoribosyltransferase
MKDSKLLDLFPLEYRELIQRYVENLSKIFQKYDVVIFMARKAICFYKALLIGGFIEKPLKCNVISDRVLTYNVLKDLKGGKIILVDDVVEGGKTITNAQKILSDYDIKADMYILARKKLKKEKEKDEDELEEDLLRCENIIETYVEMVEEDRLQLSKCIAGFIEANMCPYNIDQPIYRFIFPDDEMFADFVKNHNLIYTSDEQQQIHGIESYFLEIPNKYFTDPILKDHVELCKIRFLRRTYHDKTVLLAIPFVLFRKMEINNLETAFSLYENEQIRQFIQNKNVKIFYENQLKILHFVYSAHLMGAFMHLNANNNIKFKRLDSNDKYVFFKDILPIINEVKNPFDFAGANISNNTDFICEFKQNEYLNLTYNFIYLGKKKENTGYFKSNDKPILSGALLVLSDLKKYIENKISDEFDILLFSHIIDVLIDKGLIIPSVVHGGNLTIIRAYKYGECKALNEEHFKLFGYALSEYLKKIGRNRLQKTEFEKLCVLFFKVLDDKFLSSSDCGEEKFCVCYSKFGPRVSTPDPDIPTRDTMYSAEEESTLAKRLSGGYIKLIGSAYEVSAINEKDAIQKQDWIRTAQSFAVRQARLYNELFKGDYGRRLFDTYRDMYIVTYIEFLTMLSIGLSKKNQLLSLLAEIYLISHKTKIYDDDIIRTLNTFSGILDGLVSGMWKYTCYDKKEHSKINNSDPARKNKSKPPREHPLEKIRKNIYSDPKTDYLAACIEEVLSLNPDIEVNDLIEPMIQEAGNLIFSTVYSVWFMFKKYKIRYYEHDKAVDLSVTKQREYFYSDNLRISIVEQIQSSTKAQDLQTLRNLQYAARKLLDSYNANVSDGTRHVKENGDIKKHETIIKIYDSNAPTIIQTFNDCSVVIDSQQPPPKAVA